MWNKSQVGCSRHGFCRTAGLGTALPVSSAGLAFFLAWAERFGYLSVGLDRLRGGGFLILLVILGVVVAHAFGRCLTRWVAAAAALATASLMVDSLPLLALGKSQVAVLLVGLSQWATTQHQTVAVPRRVVVLAVFFFVGALIEAAYFLALMQNHHVVVFF
jgi:hypothetical protein